ncbi:MAG TPA: metallophosphoesterase family protein [Pyrinomonadaceae bacterium]|jgi:3',5'-cyclic AMP phosphodiesterase CpdA|nr:metallophosphoesterase family protein [Pyrinomonadaceae bacterium]
MRTILHLSDIHFGRVNDQVIAPLVEAVTEINPDLVAVSGDLTQRARSHQFKEARAFLDILPKPQIVVPGNHDVPLHNVWARFLRPLHKYRRYITADLRPFYQDKEIAIAGVSTARSLTIKGGRISAEQVAWVHEKFCALDSEVAKIVVTHHPFDLPEGHDERQLVGRARMAMEALASCGADVFLAGHFHTSHTTHTASRYQIKGHSALVVQAGTATSTRGRGEENSFNVVRIDRPHITVERFKWQQNRGKFGLTTSEDFHHTAEGWARV